MTTPIPDWAKMAHSLDVEDLSVDHSYHRPLPKAFLKEVSTNFDSNAVGYLTVSKRNDGSTVVVDGQTRLEAAKAVGLKRVPCIVFRGLSSSEEAKLFIALNTRAK